jgi:four helix bundle protein
MNIEQGISNNEENKKKAEPPRKFDLEDRLIDFAVLIIKITETIVNTKAGNHLEGQLVRSGTSPSLQYGEAQSAESPNDFIHKLKVLLKELRESSIAMKVIKKANLSTETALLESGLKECNELISIFVRSIDTARKNSIKKSN